MKKVKQRILLLSFVSCALALGGGCAKTHTANPIGHVPSAKIERPTQLSLVANCLSGYYNCGYSPNEGFYIKSRNPYRSYWGNPPLRIHVDVYRRDRWGGHYHHYRHGGYRYH